MNKKILASVLAVILAVSGLPAFSANVGAAFCFALNKIWE